MRKAKLGAGALLIIGIIYCAIGGIFAILGTAFVLSAEADLSLVGMVFVSTGGFFLILGAVLLTLQLRKKKRAEAMMAAGRYVWAEVVDCVPNYSVRINNRHPYILMARYVDPQGVNHVFKSPSLRIYRDPGLIGRQVKVYYDGESFRHYYLDAEPILPNFIEH